MVTAGMILIFESLYHLLEQPANYVINPTNTCGVMGAGVALEFKRRYPKMFRSYVQACETGELRVGTLHVWKCSGGVTAVNFPTKRHWKDNSRLSDIERGLEVLAAHASTAIIAMPSIGCGLGGLSWEKHVAPAIEQYLPRVEVLHCTAPIPPQKPLSKINKTGNRQNLLGQSEIWRLGEIIQFAPK